jgi:HAMP domain-containing protein
MPRLRSLQAQILLWITLPLILVLVTVSLGSITLHQRSMRTMVAERDAKLAGLAAGRLDDNLQAHIAALRLILAAAGRSSDPVAAVTGDGPPAASFSLGLVLFDAQGNPLTKVPAVYGASSATAVQAALRRPGKPTYVFVPSATNPTTVVLALADPATQRVAAGGVSATDLGLPTLFDQIQQGGGAQPYLVDQGGHIIYHQDSGQIGRDRKIHPGVLQALQGESGATFAHLSGEQEHVVGYAPLPATGWALLVEEPWADVIVPALQYTLWAPILVLVAAVASLIALYFGLRRVVQPLQVLGRFASRLAWGDFQAIEKPVGGIDEIVQLQGTLQEMAAQIHRYQAGMQDYIAALTRTQEEERRRLARELHDETVQSLIAIAQRVRILELDWRSTERSEPVSADVGVEERLRELSEMVNQGLHEVRGVIRDLRPIYLARACTKYGG